MYTPPGASKHFVCMGAGRWINCSTPKDEGINASCPVEDQDNGDSEINVGATASPSEYQETKEREIEARTTPGVPGSQDEWPALGGPKGEQKEEWPALGIPKGEQEGVRPPNSGTSYAEAAASTPDTRLQSYQSAAPPSSFLPTHCLIPLHFEHKQQPRRKCKDRSLRAYHACPQRLTKRELHASRIEREALARNNSRVAPRASGDPVNRLFRRLFLNFDPRDQPSFLEPTPLLAASANKPKRVRPDWSNRGAVVRATRVQ